MKLKKNYLQIYSYLSTTIIIVVIIVLFEA